MRRATLTVASLVAAICVSTAARAADAVATFTKKSEPDTNVEFNEVYGSVSYTLNKPFQIKNGKRKEYEQESRALTSAMKSLANTLNSLFGKTKGSYILTVEMQVGDETVRAPILSISSEVESILFFEKSRNDFFQISQEKTLRDYIPITVDNNKVNVTLKASHLESSTIDLGIIRKFIDLKRQLSGLTTLPVASPATLAVSSIEGVLKDIFDTEKKVISQSSIEMAFIEKAAAGKANSVEIVISTKPKVQGTQYTVNLPIQIDLGIYPTRLAASPNADGKFESPVPTSILVKTRLVPGGSRKETLFGALRTTSDERVRVFLDTLIEKRQVKDEDAFPGCRDFYNALSGHMVKRDQAAFYLAFVYAYSFELSNSKNGSRCLSGHPIKQELSEWIELPDDLGSIIASAEAVKTPNTKIRAVTRSGEILDPAKVQTIAPYALDQVFDPSAFSTKPGTKFSLEPGTIPLMTVK
jgi:hypothetical protein